MAYSLSLSGVTRRRTNALVHERRTTPRLDSGLASEYLNHFNDIIMMFEQLPKMPELLPNILAWRPLSYRDFFAAMDAGRSTKVLRSYDAMDPIVRRAFEAVVAGLDKLAADAVKDLMHAVMDREREMPDLAVTAKFMSILMERATSLINDGEVHIAENAQRRADRLLGW